MPRGIPFESDVFQAVEVVIETGVVQVKKYPSPFGIGLSLAPVTDVAARPVHVLEIDLGDHVINVIVNVHSCFDVFVMGLFRQVVLFDVTDHFLIIVGATLYH